MGDVKTIIQKWVAILIILVLFMGQYAITGFLATSYAIDLLATQSENVQFRAYFKNGQEELTEIQKSIDSKDLKLNIAVAVKNQGYFNGQISFANAGFKLDETTTNNYISKIENNVIYLKQINAEETANIEVGIKYFEEDKIQASTLNQTTTVKLNGTYTGSNGNTTIDSGSDVKVIWNIPENTKAELASKIQTNSTYSVNGENKKIVQFLTSSKLTNNAYPVKNTQITATIPAGATNIEVHKRTTKATNGEQEFTSANYKVENNVLTINVNNTETEGKISWMKGVLDIFVVTYEYPESVELSEQTITVNEKITAQNNTELNAEQVQLSLTEAKDGIVSISKQEKENSIYKGKIYSGEGRDYTSYTLVYVDYASGVSSMEITEIGGMYGKEVNQFSIGRTDSTIFGNYNLIKNVKVNKEKVASVLGNTWELTIGNNTITNETEADSNGDITVQLPDKTDNVTIKTSKPVNNGSFIIETTKNLSNIKNPSLGNTEKYTREELREFKNIADMAWIEKNNIHNTEPMYLYNITLKDTETNASLQSEQTALIAGSNSQSLNLTAVLETKGEHQDLYKNPEIKIKLPSQVKNVAFAQKPQLIQANGLELTDENYKVVEENGQKVLSIKLTGEQAIYPGQAVQGTTISIRTNAEIDQNAQNSQEEIVMTYTNENATKYTDNGIEKIKVQVVETQNQGENTGSGSQASVNQGSGSGSQSGNSGNEQTSNAELKYEISASVGGNAISEGDTVKAGEIITYTTKITNQTATDKTGLTIEANIPDSVSLIEINPKYPADRFYSAEEIDNPNNNINKNYFVELDNNKITINNVKIETGKIYYFKYMVRVNTNIEQNTNIQNTIKIKDGNNEKEITTNNIATKSNIFSELIPIARTGTEELKAGYGYIYKLIVKNISDTEQKNVKVTINKNELIEVANIDYILDNEMKSVEKDNLTFVIDSIKPNSIAYIEMDTSINPYNENSTNAEMFATITDSNNNIFRTNKLSEIVSGVKIKATLSSQTSSNNANRYLKNGDTVIYKIKLENTGRENTKELSIKDRISPYIDVEGITIDGNKCEYTKGQEEDDDQIYDIYIIDSTLKAGDEQIIEVKGKVKNDISENGKLTILNKAFISDIVKITETQEEIYYLENISTNSNKDDNNNDDNNNTDNNNNNNANYSDDYTEIDNNDNNEIKDNKNGFSISGNVWLDEDRDGKRIQEELLLEGIKVYAINVETNRIKVSSQTDSNGKYNLQNLTPGRYIVAFEYDTSIYNVTLYKADGVDESQNSDAVKANRMIENQEKNVAITDIITISNDQESIDLGLVEATKGNVKIEKTISNIIVTNKEGTKKYDFDDINLAKVEISSKDISGSNVLIEYKIKITNQGNSDVYIKNIIDNLPSSLEFNSNLNEDWYKKDGYLINTTLNKEKINAGDTKEVTLILTKKMTASNTGLVNNKAEIESIYNSDGTENDSGNTSSADVIISIKTGEEYIYLLFVVVVILIALETIYIVKKIIRNLI